MSFPHPALSTADAASRHAACPRPVEAHAVMEGWDAAERSPPTSASSVQKSDAECNVRFTCHFWVCDGLAAKVPSPVGVKGPSWPWRQKLCLESLGHNFCISCLDFVHHRELDYISLMMKATSVFLLWTWASLSIWKSSALALGAKEMCSAWKVRTHRQLKTSPHLQSCCCLGDRKLKRCETRQQRPWNTNSFLCNFFCWDDNTSSFVYLCHRHIGLGLLGKIQLSVAQNELEDEHLEKPNLGLRMKMKAEVIWKWAPVALLMWRVMLIEQADWKDEIPYKLTQVIFRQFGCCCFSEVQNIILHVTGNCNRDPINPFQSCSSFQSPRACFAWVLCKGKASFAVW